MTGMNGMHGRKGRNIGTNKWTDGGMDGWMDE